MVNEDATNVRPGRGGARLGAGRKKKATTRISVNVQKDVERILQLYSYEHELSISECVNRILRDWYYSKYGIRP